MIARGQHALSPKAFEVAANETDAVVLDVRHQDEFAAGHVPRSIFNGLNGAFAPWVGALIKDVNQSILLVVEKEKLKEAITRLSRVGFDNIFGYLDGGIEAWKSEGKELDRVSAITASAFKDVITSNVDTKVVDVRKASEYLSEHIISAVNFPLSEINEYLAEMPSGEDVYVHCKSGYRSMIASSILKSRGVHNVIDLEKGFDAIKEADIPVSYLV